MPHSTGYYEMNDFTVCEEDIRDLRDLINLSVLEYGSISEILTVDYGVWNGKVAGYLGQMGMVGKNKPMCKPDWDATKINTSKDAWLLGPVMVTEEICADDFVDTIVKWSMNTGTNKADMSNGDYMNVVVEPKLTEAMNNMVWRVAFHADTAADTVTNGGHISDTIDGEATDLDFFNMTDGIWKRVFAAVPTTSAHYVRIAANYEATKALQMSAILGDGVAMGIFDQLIYGASMTLRQRSDKMLLVTQSLADALARDIRQSNAGSDLQWESIFNGLLSATQYNTMTIVAVPKLDEMIQTFNDAGATFYLPHRAVFAAKEQLRLGFEGDSILPLLKVWFSEDDQVTRMLARDEMGTMIVEPNLISAAY